MNEIDISGPIDYVLIEFPPGGPTGGTAEAVMSLVDRGVVRLYDMVMVRKGENGAVENVDASDLAPEAAFAFSELKERVLGCSARTTLPRSRTHWIPGRSGCCSCSRTHGRSPS